MKLRTVALAVSLALPPGHAAAEDAVPFSDLHGRQVPVADLVPHPLLPLAESGARPSLSLSLSVVERPTRRDVTGGILLSFPTDVLAAPRKAKTEEDEELDEAPPPEPEARAVAPPPPRLRIRPEVARAAIVAAMRERGAELSDERADDLSTRARWSAILPEVRLRATRLVDESSSLSPTSYDPERTTSSGGVSLWLEARTTWYFDRLVFAGDEVRIERLRQDIGKERRRLAARVLELLFGWQRAAYRARDPLVDPQRCVEAVLAEEQLAIELDILTGGWFARWLRHNPPAGPDCLEREA